MVPPLCVRGGSSETSLELRHVAENGRSLSGQALLGPESATRVGGSGRARGSGESTLKKEEEEEKEKKEKKRKTVRSSREQCPHGQVLRPSCPARLPGQRRWQSTE